MPQISMSNTAVIDLADIQKIVTAINRHDDLLSQIVSAYTGSAETDSSGSDTYSGIFDISSQVIKYGKYKLKNTGTGTAKSFTVEFGKAPNFAGFPVVTVTVDGKTADTSVYVTMTDISQTGFKGVVNGITADATVYLHWIAIGTRAG